MRWRYEWVGELPQSVYEVLAELMKEWNQDSTAQPDEDAWP